MRKALTTVRRALRPIAALWSMWIAELAAGFAGLAQALRLSHAPRYRLTFSEGTLALSHQRGGVLQSASGANEQEPASIASQLSARREPVALVLPASLVLWHTLRISAAAGRRWREAVRLQFTAWFPLPEEACLWEAHAERCGGELQVRVALAQRGAVERWLGAFQSTGWQISQVLACDDNEELDLTPRSSLAHALLWQRVNYALAATVATLLVAASWLAIQHREAEQTTLTELLRTSRRAAQPALQTRDALTYGLTDLAPALTAARSPTATALLTRLSGALPQEGWITQFSWKMGTVTFTGSAPPDLDWQHLLKDTLDVDAKVVHGVPENSKAPRVVSTLAFQIGPRL